MVGRSNTTNVGGAAAQEGISYQNRVAAWFAVRILAEEATVQDAAVVSAREAVRVLNNQYLAGTVAYTSVIVAEQTALQGRRGEGDSGKTPPG